MWRQSYVFMGDKHESRQHVVQPDLRYICTCNTGQVIARYGHEGHRGPHWSMYMYIACRPLYTQVVCVHVYMYIELQVTDNLLTSTHTPHGNCNRGYIHYVFNDCEIVRYEKRTVIRLWDNACYVHLYILVLNVGVHSTFARLGMIRSVDVYHHGYLSITG